MAHSGVSGGTGYSGGTEPGDGAEISGVNERGNKVSKVAENKNELIVLADLNAVEVFTGPQGVEKILTDIEAKVAAFVPDVSTDKGRKAIASTAYKVSQSKVLLDDLGKKLVSDWKTKAALVDSSRKTARDRLDALRDKVREPLTLWEEAEAKRVAAEKLAKEIAEAEEAAYVEHELWLRAKEIEKKEAELAKIEAGRLAKEQAEREAQEAKEAAERAEIIRKENEERIRREAEEKAKREAEEKAQAAIAEAERKEREAKEAAEKAERDRQLAIEKAEADRIAAQKKAEEERVAAVAAAEEEARKKAAKIEADRIAAEKAAFAKAEAERVEAERKAADIEHRRTINREVMDGLVSAGISEKQAKEVITAIVGGLIKHVVIKY